MNFDGSTFLGKLNGLGVVGHLYSKELESGEKDAGIETWFAEGVDEPFAEVLRNLVGEVSIKRRNSHLTPTRLWTH